MCRRQVPYKFWEVLRSVIGAGVDGFVYSPPHVRTPIAQRSNRKSTTQQGGKSPKTSVSLRDRVMLEGVEGEEEEKQEMKLPAAPTASSGKDEHRDAGKRRARKSSRFLVQGVHDRYAP